MVRIAIDAMGGDFAPEKIVAGVIKTAKELTDTEFQLYGDEAAIRTYLTEELANIKVIHCSEKIMSDDEPVRSIRRKKDASMVVAAKAVKEGQADALFSAGNTGALLASGLFIVGRIKGIDRPGLMPVLPVFNGDKQQFVMMDVGANADCKPYHLEQFGILGTYYSQYVLGVKNPTVGLLNNGTESTKGNELTKEVHKLLTANEAINFIGNVEARELLQGPADVVVTDGFTGNAVLKTIEGTAIALLKTMKRSILSSGLKAKLGAVLLKPTFKKLKSSVNYEEFGGAVLLGVKGPVVKAHGTADETTVYYTLKQIQTIVTSNVITDLVDYFENN